MAEPVHEGTAAPAHGGGSSGLPQFDPTWWPGQAIWFVFIFVVVFLVGVVGSMIVVIISFVEDLELLVEGDEEPRVDAYDMQA